jgi:hypothetical protein
MKTMNHAEYQRNLKGKTEAELRYTISDAREAVNANPDNHNAGYYQDEIHYAAAELRRRKFDVR